MPNKSPPARNSGPPEKTWQGRSGNLLKVNHNIPCHLLLGQQDSARAPCSKPRQSYENPLRARLKADVKFFFHSLQEFVEPPQDFARPRTWEHFAYEMEMEMRRLEKSVQEPHLLSGNAILDPLVNMINYRDALMATLLNGLLFQKAVLDWDLKSERQYADGPMVLMLRKAHMIVSIVMTSTCTSLVVAGNLRQPSL